MLNVFRKQNKTLGFLLLVLLCSNSLRTAFAVNTSPMLGNFYLGLFGGGGASNNGDITQSGTALYGPSKGGPLAVNATGSSDQHGVGMGGLHAGYEWMGWQLGKEGSKWNLKPAAEIEGYYLGGMQSAQLLNPTTRIPNHTFADTFSMHTGVFLANTVWSFSVPSLNRVQPYIGAGVGAATITNQGAYSAQLNPAEPGINHFNSNTSASDWAFAAQAKLGLRVNVTDHWRFFAEYRYLYLSPTSYTYGSTQYATHVPTTKWNVNFERMQYNMGVLGVEYKFDALS